MHQAEAHGMKARAGALGAVEAAAAMVAAHPADVNVQRAGCAALAAACQAHTGNQDRAATSGALRVIAAGLKAEGRDAATQPILLQALTAICGNRLTVSAKAAELGAVESVVAVMLHADQLDIQTHCCRALSSLTACVDDRGAGHEQFGRGDVTPQAMAIRQRAVDAGAFASIVAAMKRHATSADMQEVGGVAIANVCCGSNENQAKAADAGAIEALVAAMRAHESAWVVQESACSAFRNICTNTANRTRACRAGALAACTLALRTHGAHATVVETACAALSNIMASNAAHAAKVVDAGALPALVAALRTHIAVESVLVHVFSVLGNALVTLGANAAVNAEVMAAGAIQAMASVLRAHQRSTNVLRSVCVCFGNVCGDSPSSIAKAGSEGVMELMAAVLLARPADAELQEGVMYALSHLCSPGNHDRFGAAGGLEAAVAALKAHGATRPTLFCYCCSVVCVPATCSPRTVQRAIAAGAVEAIIAVLTAARWDVDTHAEQHKAAFQTLRMLTHEQPEAALRAVCAGGLALWTGDAQTEPLRASLLPVLQPAAQRHDGMPCVHAACARCADQRSRGLVCGLEGCGRRTRAGDSGKKLLRCGGCRTLAYCETAHQHADWRVRHKAECKQSDAGGGASADA
jgi:hypothetical protein